MIKFLIHFSYFIYIYILYIQYQNMDNNQQQPIDPILYQCWQAINLNKEQYVGEDKIIQWVNRVLVQKINVKQTIGLDLKGEFKIYLEEVHKFQQNTVTNVKFSYEEAVGFYQYIFRKIQAADYAQDMGQEGEQGEELGLQQAGQRQDENRENQQRLQKQQNEKQNLHNSKVYNSNQNNINQPSTRRNLEKQNSHRKIQKHSTQPQQQPQQNYLYPSNKINKPTNVKQEDTEKQLEQNQNQFADQQQNNMTPLNNNQPSIGKNYREYLLTIFEHYCRMSYATGNDPTFEQIQQKTQVMTINKFMVFCKQYGIVKLNGMGRANLVQIFKKNAQFYKQMAYEQFMNVLIKISKIVYGEGQKQQANQSNQPKQKNQNQSSKQFQQLLLFLQVNNFNAFKKKAQTLNIALRPKVNTQSQPKKIVPAASGGKTQEQVRQQIEQRKRIRSQNKLKVLKNRPKIASSKKDIKILHQQRDKNDRGQIKTIQPTKKLDPPLPPARRISNFNQPKNVAQDPTIGVTGYANIHKLKLIGKQGQVDSRMKLNSIVQQAKKILKLDNEEYKQYPPSNRASTYNREITPNSNYANYKRNYTYQNGQQYDQRDLAQSQQSNYSQRDLRVLDQYPISKRSYAPHGHSQLQKRVPQKSKTDNEQLKEILGNEDSDKDQFLQQHLNRQKKVGSINERIQKKIKQFQLKEQRN